ncbi:MAG: metal-dependent transcriptional regulator [Spirochaetales bacterium]|nr:metal-dependent transcriptional regulator [Spirochaetales bacterium]MCF7938406.1 metal-dependent transcriptional regulator [Spirochaetales bacterium]
MSTDSKDVLSQSLEDYLEAILELERKNRVARVKDIAKKLNVQMPSVTGALKNLKDRNLVNYEKNSFISLTDAGMEIATGIFNRHTIIRTFLQDILLIPSDESDEMACTMEHSIDVDTARKLCHLTRYLKNNVLGDLEGGDWEKILNRRPDKEC